MAFRALVKVIPRMRKYIIHSSSPYSTVPLAEFNTSPETWVKKCPLGVCVCACACVCVCSNLAQTVIFPPSDFSPVYTWC